MFFRSFITHYLTDIFRYWSRCLKYFSICHSSASMSKVPNYYWQLPIFSKIRKQKKTSELMVYQDAGSEVYWQPPFSEHILGRDIELLAHLVPKLRRLVAYRFVLSSVSDLAHSVFHVS